MNVKFLDFLSQAVKNITELCNKLASASDPEKFASGVNALNLSLEQTFDEMRRLIREDTTLSAEEKLDRLERLAAKQEAAMASCGRAIIENREHSAKVIKEVFMTITTGGIFPIVKASVSKEQNMVKGVDKEMLPEGKND